MVAVNMTMLNILLLLLGARVSVQHVFKKDVSWFLDGVKKLKLETGSGSSGLTEEEKEAVEDFISEYQLETIISLIKADNTIQEQRNALGAGEELLAERERWNRAIRESNITFDPNDPSFLHQLHSRITHPISTNMAKLGIVMQGATLNFTEALDIPSVSTVALPLIGPLPNCTVNHHDRHRPTFVNCRNHKNKYRTIDGSCNNVNNKLWGASFTPFRRDLPADFLDGVSVFRKSVTGKELPSARLVSSTINNKPNVNSRFFSIFRMTFGLIIDHDITSTPIARGSLKGFPEDGSPIKCCNVSKNLTHPECAPIDIPLDDPFYKYYNQTCMEFVRSAPIGNCTMGPRENINQQTAYIDGSVVYGARPDETDKLRTFENGLLKGQITKNNNYLLPPDETPPDNSTEGCNVVERYNKGQYCFKAGDFRVNEQIQLTFLQTLFAREHNRLAGILKAGHSQWDDEKLFQEARRIVGAQLQQVTYNEYLPTLLSPDLMDHFNLHPLTGNQQTSDYDENLNSAVSNSFATAVYRMGHSLVADNMIYISKQGQVTTNELTTILINPFYLYQKRGMCNIARGAIALPGCKMDPYFSLEVNGKLFSRAPRPFGLDVTALSIQRGRDHGLPPYNEWREFCGLPKAQTFDDLKYEITSEKLERLRMAYQNVDDIDFHVGGLSENALPGGILGHTFTCIIIDQFVRAQRGDRYWFEYKNGPGAFTKAQIKQLHQVTLARIMCNNLPDLKKVSRWPLKNLAPGNLKVRCKFIRPYNLDPWK